MTPLGKLTHSGHGSRLAAIEIYRRMPCEVWVSEAGEIFTAKPSAVAPLMPLSWFVGTYSKAGTADETRTRITIDLRERAQELPATEKALAYDRQLAANGRARERNATEPFRCRRAYFRERARAARGVQADGRKGNHPGTRH